jgi:alkanesulfonate monooxygenase SsuD/methylene tetrahydromethanopterin reductase-like flavin-dependent oxidoreductase (luciferase family)
LRAVRQRGLHGRITARVAASTLRAEPARHEACSVTADPVTPSNAEEHMKFGFLTEGDTPRGYSVASRYHEVIREAQFAEEMGFDFWGASEQHFTGPVATISAPEVLFAAVAQATTRIKIRSMSCVMLHFNHPLRIAERLATLDILSKGRMEFGTARGNNHHVVSAFEIDAANSRAEWEETLRLTVKALTTDPVEHEGRYYKVSPVTVWPRLYQPHFPPIYLSSTSLETHQKAGELGIGVTSFTFYGWEYMEQALAAYKKAVATATPIPGARVNDSVGILFVGGQVASTTAKALELARPGALGFMKFLIDFFGTMADTAPDYAYLKDWQKLIAGHEDDLDYMNEALPLMLNGTPDEVIEKLRKFEAMGVDEAILRIDGNGHRQIMEAIEMLGKYVIPEFKNRANVVRQSTYEDVGVIPPPYML